MISTQYNFSGKLAVITGGGTGIGFKIAGAFSEAGAKVIITGRRESVLKDACGRLGENAAYIVNDIQDLGSLPGLVESIETGHGQIEILVNNSGINLKKHVLDTRMKNS
jgi:short-subunit dehydrogenase involved in D-alanine esterification of teichoic acids